MSKSTVWITMGAKVRTLGGLTLFLLFFLLACKSNLPYYKQIYYGEPIRDSLPVSYLQSQPPSGKLLIYLTRKPDSLSYWKSDFFKYLHKKGGFDIIKPGLASSYDFFLKESMDIKTGRTQDLIGLVQHLQKQNNRPKNSRLYLLAENMEAEVAVNLASHTYFEKVILINLSRISQLHDISSLLDKRPLDSLTANYLQEYRIDTALSKNELLNYIRNQPGNAYSIGDKRNFYWLSYLDNPVMLNFPHVQGDVHLLYPPHPILELYKASESFKSMHGIKKAREWHFYKVPADDGNEKEPLQNILQQILMPED